MSATSALKGYRTQFLYSLNRILFDFKKDYIFQPEGKFEDLDILDSNHNYIEIIQVKNKNESLVFSDLVSKKTSFFERAIKAIEHSPSVTIKLISFSTISEELTDLNKLEKKLKKKGYKDIVVKQILNNYKFEIFQESEIEIELLKKLKELSLFTDPKIALELLLYWLFIAGEKQESIISKELISKLEKIGKFTNEQLSFNNHFGNTIIPFSTKSILNDDIETYKEGFYYGISAKYEHILANLDVYRKDKLDAINDAFSRDNIVFIYGASGQGKSTLAYRYINDFTSNNTSYELKVSQNLKEVYETINSLEALSKGLDFPILLYIDIKPQDVYWNDILKELYGKKNLRFLITIRQEDWNKATLRADFKFSEIDLTFNKNEAEIIYNNLTQIKEDLKFIDFEESWYKFQKGGMLLEYVYLISQGDTLKSRLEGQVRRIEEKVSVTQSDELEILRYVCLADVFNSKISYKQLISKLNIKVPKLYIDYFEKEYLLQYSQDKEYLTGLHPIRSRLLCEILFDENSYVNINDYITNSLNLIDERDLQIYLLESFSRDFEIDVCLETFKNLKFKTWTGYAGVFNALIWKGMHDFIFDKNIVPISKLYDQLKEHWSYYVPFDFANNERKNGIFGILEGFFSEEKTQGIRDIQNEFTSKHIVYDYVKEWLKNESCIEAKIFDSLDLKSLGEINFWVYELKLNVEIVFNENDLINKLDHALSLKDFSILLFGLQLNEYNDISLAEIKNKFIHRLRRENNILVFNDGKDVECEFFYDPIEFDEKSNHSGDFLHSITMKIIDLLRFAFPDKEKYSTKGLGITFFGIEMPYDPTNKAIPIENIPNSYLVTHNAMVGNLYNFQFKPTDWNHYVLLLVEKRQKYIELTSILIQKFEEYFKDKDIVKFVTSLNDLKSKVSEIKSIPFPKNISDRWGYISDGSNLKFIEDTNNNKILDESITALKKYSKLRSYSNRFFNSLSGFFNTVDHHVISIMKIKLSLNNEEDYNPNPAFTNIKDSLKNCNLYHEEFVNLFSKFYDEKELEQIHIKENRNLEILFNCWHQFYFKRGNLNSKIIKQTNQNFTLVKNEINNRLITERKKTYRETGFLLNIYLNKKVENTLILTCEICSNELVTALLTAREFLQKTIKTNYTSVKSVYIDSNINKVVFIPFFSGKPINKTGIEIMKYNLHEEIEDAGTCFNPLFQINDDIIDFLNLEFWNATFPVVSNYERVLGDIAILNELQNQLKSIKSNCSNFDEIGSEILKNYEIKLQEFLGKRFVENKDLWEEIKINFNDESLHMEVSEILNKFLAEEFVETGQLQNVSTKFDSNYHPFVESLIKMKA